MSDRATARSAGRPDHGRHRRSSPLDQAPPPAPGGGSRGSPSGSSAGPGPPGQPATVQRARPCRVPPTPTRRGGPRRPLVHQVAETRGRPRPQSARPARPPPTRPRPPGNATTTRGGRSRSGRYRPSSRDSTRSWSAGPPARHRGQIDQHGEDPGVFDVAEELVARGPGPRWPPRSPRGCRRPRSHALIDPDHPQVGLERGEGVVGDLGLGRRDARR